MSFKFEYLGKIEFILETKLRYASGDQVVSCDEKTRGQKSGGNVA
jgi:hypothetical protein